jgi:membrane-associated phospholipid phosphatase
MSRGIGEFEPIQELVPEWLAVVVALLTQLGDIWFLALVLATLYWFRSSGRDDVAVVGGVWLAGMGLYKGLKEVFGFPRPEQPLLDPELLPRIVQPVYEATAFATGYGFPSGHAVNATIVYFGLAYVLPYGTPRRRFVGAAALVAVVSVSRVVLGVHYLVDIVVGVIVGATLLFVARSLMERTPADRATVAFALAIVLAVFFVGASDAHPDAIFVLAASLGTFAGWQLVMAGRQLVTLDRSSPALRPVAARGGAALAAVAPLLVALGVFPPLSSYAVGGALGLAATGLVAAPVAWHSDAARRAASTVRTRLAAALARVRNRFD